MDNQSNSFNQLLWAISDQYGKDKICNIIQMNREKISASDGEIERIKNAPSGFMLLKYLEIGKKISEDNCNILELLFPEVKEKISKFGKSKKNEGNDNLVIIYARNGRKLYLSANNDTVYEPLDDNNGEKLGKLLSIKSKKPPIEYENGSYTVVDFEPIKYQDHEYLRCIFENKLYQKIGNKYAKVGKVEWKNKEATVKLDKDKGKINMSPKIASILRKKTLTNQNLFIDEETKEKWDKLNKTVVPIFDSISGFPGSQLKKIC